MVHPARFAGITAAVLVLLAGAASTARAQTQNADGGSAAPRRGEISIAYETPKNPAHQKVYELIRERRTLETLQLLLSPFRLPVDLELKTVPCDGVVDAFFYRKGDRREIRVCYEFLQEIMQAVPNEPTPAGVTPQDALIGPLFLVLMHEAGHAIYDIFKVPILGNQEDAADLFAIYAMLQFGGQHAFRLIRGAGYSYKRMLEAFRDRPQVSLPLTAFSSEHSRPEQRFFNLACMAYGYDAKLFAEMVDQGFLPEKRAKTCKGQYGDIAFAMDQLIVPHVDKALARQVLDRRWPDEETPATGAR